MGFSKGNIPWNRGTKGYKLLTLPVAEVIQKYLSGMTIFEIAPIYKVNPKTVWGLLKRNKVRTKMGIRYSPFTHNINPVLPEEWVIGFCEGEGSWTIAKGKKTCPYFVVSQNDEKVLLKLKEFFGIGTVTKNNRDSGNYVYKVSSYKGCLFIMQFFDRHKLHTRNDDYEKWRNFLQDWLKTQIIKANNISQ